MDFRKEAADKLRCYLAKQTSLVSIEEELHRLEEDFGRLGSSCKDSPSVSGGENHAEDALINNIALREELSAAKKDVVEWLRIVDRAFECLDEEEKRVLDLMYIHRAKGNVDQLCAELYIERPTVYRRKDAALRKFTIALYGILER